MRTIYAEYNINHDSGIASIKVLWDIRKGSFI